jgi:hypothetical protein
MLAVELLEEGGVQWILFGVMVIAIWIALFVTITK